MSDLITERLILRSLTAEHVAAVVGGDRLAHWADDFPDGGDRIIAGMLARKPPEGLPYGQRQVIERDTGLAVGGVGLFWPPNDGAVEFGYGIVPSRQGRGYATEAAGALVQHALTLSGVADVFADVESANPASIRVLVKAGLQCRSDNGETLRFFA